MEFLHLQHLSTNTGRMANFLTILLFCLLYVWGMKKLGSIGKQDDKIYIEQLERQRNNCCFLNIVLFYGIGRQIAI